MRFRWLRMPMTRRRDGLSGRGLARALAEADIECTVAAPSKLLGPAGDRVKTDARDAAHLTRLLRLGEITAVSVPQSQVEAARYLARARADARADLMRVRHRLSRPLLRHDRVYSGGQAWTGLHEIWLRRLRFDNPHTAAAFDRHSQSFSPSSRPACQTKIRSAVVRTPPERRSSD
jgi:transposase